MVRNPESNPRSSFANRLRASLAIFGIASTAIAGAGCNNSEVNDQNSNITPNTVATDTRGIPSTKETPPSPGPRNTEPPSPEKTLDDYLRGSAITGVDQAAEKLRNGSDPVPTLTELAAGYCDYPSATESDETSARSVLVPESRAKDLTQQASCMTAMLTAVKNTNNPYNIASVENITTVFETGVETFIDEPYQEEFRKDVDNFNRATSKEVTAVSEEMPLAKPGEAVAYSSSRNEKSSMTVEENRNLAGWRDYNFEGISSHVCAVTSRSIYDLKTGGLKSGEEARTKLTCVSPEKFTDDKGGDLGAKNGWRVSQDESDYYSCITIDGNRVKIDGAGETIGTCE